MGDVSFSKSFFLSLILASLIPTSCLSTGSHDLFSSLKHQECIHQHFSALLRLKQSFRFTPYSTTNLSSWNVDERDCCGWEGITCDRATGYVISLDLSEFGVSGQVDFQTLAHLPTLQILSLGNNSFDPSPIPSAIGQLNELTNLNLSWGCFYGQIPVEMSNLSRLVSLDLSTNGYANGKDFMYLKLEKPSIGALIQNMSRLRELCLDQVDMSTEGREWSQVISSALPRLRKLSVSGCGLIAPIHPSFFHLSFLSQLHLSYNNLSSSKLDSIGNLTSLTSLDLAFCGLDGRSLDRISGLPCLTNLDLSSNNLSSSKLDSIGNLTSLTSLGLASCGLDGRYLDRILRLPCLTRLALDSNNLSFVRLDFAANFSSFRSLTQLLLSDCSMSGPLPFWVVNLTTLEDLDLSDNSFSGSIPFSYGNALVNLKKISLDDNLLNGTIPNSLLSLPSLQSLSLSGNQFDGQLGEFHNASLSQLEFIDLSDNTFHGKIPRFIFQLRNLYSIYLDSNNFSVVLDPVLFVNLTKLSYLSLSENNVSVEESDCNSTSVSFPQLFVLNLRSCNIQKFPDFLKNQEKLEFLDLSCNKLEGEIPKWIWRVEYQSLYHLNLSHNALQVIETPILHPSSSNLQILDLSSNLLQGLLPIPSSLLSFYFVFNNSFSGEVPNDICSLKFLEMLDISNNNFSGHVPRCFGDMSHVLTMLNLRGNAFSGNLLQTFKQDCSLQILDLSENQFEGQLPTSLANCRRLMVFNLGNNQICDTFPWWIQSLTELRVLILRYNNFHGPIEISPSPQNLSNLHIIDLSFNSFNGSLPSAMFWGWKGMVEYNDSKLEYLKMDIYTKFPVDVMPCYYESVIVSSKSLEMHFQKIPRALTVIDVSSNCFQRQIPESIGTLKALLILNMSHNSFTGRIPASLKNLTKLESLDLSQNNLSGDIPQEISELTFLAVLNLSQNQLTGHIPHSKQFLTFTNESFQGNPGLCGPPLSKACEEETNGGASSTVTLKDEDERLLSEDDEYNWKMIEVGFGIGYGVGLGVFCWILVLWRRGRIAYCKFVYKMLLLIFPCIW